MYQPNYSTDTLFDRVKRAWNVFRTNEQIFIPGPGYSSRPDRPRFVQTAERSITESIFTRIGIDTASIPIKHVLTDDQDRYLETIESRLNNCLTFEANIDQTGRAFIQDAVMTLCDHGSVALVAVDTSTNPRMSSGFEVISMRTARIVEWYPQHVRVDIYNQRTGEHEEITIPKRTVAIVENPLYAVMNEPNSTLRRLIDKLRLLDAIDTQSASGKLDLIIQLPFAIKGPLKQRQADDRKAAIEGQLENSQHGIAYTDATEKITQLNRPVENNLMAQIEFLTRMLFSQLGITEGVFNGTPTEEELLNYYNRTVEPMSASLVGAMSRVYLTPTARTQGHALMALRDPFKYVPTTQLPEMADKLGRNEIVTPNEFRAVLGMQPNDSPESDELRNRNINEKEEKPQAEEPSDKKEED